MKKRLLAIMLCLMLFVCTLSGCADNSKTNEEAENVKVVLNEVAHSIFYAPMYAAIEKGYFEEEGIELTLVTGFGADKVMTAVISGEAQIGFMGSEASIYAYNEEWWKENEENE